MGVIEKLFEETHQRLLVDLDLSKLGFSKGTIDYRGQTSRFIREFENRIYVFFINHGVSTYGEMTLFLHPSYIVFKQVSNIVLPIQLKNNIRHYDGIFYPTITNHPKADKRSDIATQQSPIVAIKGRTLEKDFRDFTKKLNNYIKEHLIPFFESVDSINAINDEIINVVSQSEVGKYLNDPICDKLVIMKLCNNPGYEDYKNWLEETFARLLPTNPAMYEPKQKIYQELRQLLDSGQYMSLIQNID